MGRGGKAGRAGTAGSDKRVAEEPRPVTLNGELPRAYGKTRIVLLPVDPYLVHLYWEISEEGMGFVRALVETGALRPRAVVRFHDVTAMPVGGVRASDSFDVEVDLEARNWYVRLLSPEKAYVVDLGFRGTDGRFHRIARSNRGETPRAWPCGEAAEQRMRVVEVDGVVHADPVEEEADARQESASVAEAPQASRVSGHRPRVEIPQEPMRAVAGAARTPVVPAEPQRTMETQPVRRPAAPSRQEVPAPPTDLPSPPNPRPADGPEAWRSKVEGAYERRQIVPPAEKQTGGTESPKESAKGEVPRPSDTDLSLFCDRLFVSGLSSSRIAPNGGKDDQHEG
jgi:hypothetical protein